MREYKHCISSAFGLDLVNGGGVWLPQILLQSYSKLGISNMEMMLLVQLLCQKNSSSGNLNISEVAEFMGVTQEKVYSLLASLESKEILTREVKGTSFEITSIHQLNLEGLFEKLLEVWGCQKAKAYENKQLIAQPKSSDRMPGTSRVISNLYRCFEKEFGRPLSPIESTQLMEWYYGDKYSFELIIEALKRAVLRGVVNLKYIDSILRGWSKNNLKTVKAIIAYEEAFAEKKKGNSLVVPEKDAADLDQKYSDIYLT